MSEPKTAEQWLALGDKLAVELAEVLSPEPWKHEFISNPDGKSESLLDFCSKCQHDAGTLDGEMYPYMVSYKAFIAKGCSVPDPIKVDDWKEAKYWQGKCNPFAFREWIWHIWASQPERKGSFVEWVISIAQPADYLIAAAIAAERNKE